jgi:hypothetical protein
LHREFACSGGYQRHTLTYPPEKIMKGSSILRSRVRILPPCLSYAEDFMVEILKINHYKAPRDKMICILNCCKVIFGIYQIILQSSIHLFDLHRIDSTIKERPRRRCFHSNIDSRHTPGESRTLDLEYRIYSEI